MTKNSTETTDPIIVRHITVDPGTKEKVIEETYMSGFKDSFTRQQVVNDLRRSTTKEFEDFLENQKK